MFHRKTRIYIDFLKFSLHLFGVHAVLTYGNKCGPSEYQSRSGECCPMCNIGLVVLRDCDGDASTTCIPCISGTYMNKPNGLYKCFPCKICDQGLYITQDCTTTQNTVCGIRDGYYCRDYRDGECMFAVKHKRCQPGQEVKTPGTKALDTVCEACPNGFYSPLGVNCTKWTDCSVKNEHVDKEGSSVKDVTCIRRRERHGLIPVFLIASIVLLISSLKLKRIQQVLTGGYFQYTHMRTHSGDYLSGNANLPKHHVFGLWEET